MVPREYTSRPLGAGLFLLGGIMDIELYDTTLRDGAQQEGISLSAEDKIRITLKLDDLGVHYIEGGWPGSNPKDVEYFQKVKSLSLSNAKIAAFGSTRRADIKAGDDANIKALLAAETPVVTLVGKSSDLHVRRVLETTLEENLNMIMDSIAFLKDEGRTVFFDAEHFFDGFRSNPDYAKRSIRCAMDAGADCLVLCDTNGGFITSDIHKIVSCIYADLGTQIGIHCHNDADMAVANTIAAVTAGAKHVQGTINGYGERCGNANLLSIIANLKIKLGINCVSDQQLVGITDASRYVSEIVNIPPNNQQPYVGASSFSHKGGLHAAAVAKIEESYQHISPDTVGNANKIVISELSGRGNIQHKLNELGLTEKITKDQVAILLNNIKIQEAKGFQYESAEASFVVMLRRSIDGYIPPFELADFKLVVENYHEGDVSQESQMSSEAAIKIEVESRVLDAVAKGNGPVNALDNALRQALLQFYPSLHMVKLLDYKVRVVDQGQDTHATVRVLIESTDGVTQWQTVGSSSNIIEASWMALSDSMEYFLINQRE